VAPQPAKAYQWLLDGNAISGATNTTYVVPVSAVGHKITFRVTGSKSGYPSVAKTSAAVTIVLPSKVVRLAGNSRVATAVAISQKGWTTSTYVVLATGLSFPDALAGGPLASALGAPMLLTGNSANGLEVSVQAEITRLKATHVIILGGIPSVNQKIEIQLQMAGLISERLGGVDRYQTAALIATRLGVARGGPTTMAFLVNGQNFPDALSIAPVAGIDKMPILFTPASSSALNSTTATYLGAAKPAQVYVIGSAASVPDSAMNAAKALTTGKVATRIAGTDRYATNYQVYMTFKSLFTGSSLTIATGQNFPDALVGGVFAAKNKTPLFLVNGAATKANANLRTAIMADTLATTIYVFGSAASVTDLAVAVHIY